MQLQFVIIVTISTVGGVIGGGILAYFILWIVKRVKRQVTVFNTRETAVRNAQPMTLVKYACQTLPPPLPPYIQSYHTDDGHMYYCNTITGQTSWHPEEDDIVFD